PRCAIGSLRSSLSRIRPPERFPTKPLFRAVADCLVPPLPTPKREAGLRRVVWRHPDPRALASIVEQLLRQRWSPATALFPRSSRSRHVQPRKVLPIG